MVVVHYDGMKTDLQGAVFTPSSRKVERLRS